ncbi:MAG: solute:Na+ symporter, family [Cyanobacteriota bacterium erpe_2018_sw_39hr_WHONDRS-SW48-000098_B_bin.30]|nr:solute:Na+ symporter, family [Cyanobacteriota bacterium erpe_2018_sw_39hr_WHONDRS-SW48-000098_B_bin.30]
MNWLDMVVLASAIFGIAIYGMWYTRHRRDLQAYLRGRGQTPWYAIGLSVMATQASAITFLSTPGQGYLGGLSFIQIYFGVPLALIIIAIFFLPGFHKLNVYTAYEFLEKRFDLKTRLLGAALFLLQRGLGAGLTIYAPAIVLTAVCGWPLHWTIIGSGLLVMLYTVKGGSDAVTVTQKYQLAIIFAGMLTAACLLIGRLPDNLTLHDSISLAGSFHKLNAVSFSTDPGERYTIWSGILGGTFLMLSYFGTDQSQVQRYLSGSNLRESRLGLMFNAVCKIPMQLCILSIGVLLFLFYQFQTPPMFFDAAADKYLKSHQTDTTLTNYQSSFNQSRVQLTKALGDWIEARHANNQVAESKALTLAKAAKDKSDAIRAEAIADVTAKSDDVKANDADYVFITFILRELPHGVIGLLMAAFFAAALSSKAAELNALGTCTTIDFYRTIFKAGATDEQTLLATKLITAAWGIVTIIFALCAQLAENLIQAVNIIGSVFYGVLLGLFVVGFFIKQVKGNAVFIAALAAQSIIFALFFSATVSYLWFPLIGCTICVIFSIVLQKYFDRKIDNGDTNQLANKETIS